MIEIMLAVEYAPENCSAVAGYFIRVPEILNLLSTIQTPVLEDPVVHTVMSHQEKQLADVLDTLKYNVTDDGITLLSSVNGAEGFEMGSELESVRCIDSLLFASLTSGPCASSFSPFYSCSSSATTSSSS